MSWKQSTAPFNGSTGTDDLHTRQRGGVPPGQVQMMPALRKQHEKEVRLRAQRILKEKRCSMEEKQREKERVANEMKSIVQQERLATIQRLNRATEDKMQQARVLQEVQKQAREKKLQTDIMKLNEASYRRKKMVAFQRLQKTQHLVFTSQRAKVNRSAIEREKGRKQRLHEEREEARRKAAEEEKITKDIEVQRRGLLLERRLLYSIQYREVKDMLLFERGMQRKREHEERLWRHKFRKGGGGREVSENNLCGLTRCHSASTIQPHHERYTRENDEDKTRMTFFRSATSSGGAMC